jgi:hypothetical protein
VRHALPPLMLEARTLPCLTTAGLQWQQQLLLLLLQTG